MLSTILRRASTSSAAPRRASFLISKRILSTTGGSSPSSPNSIYRDAKSWVLKYWKLKAALAVGGAGAFYLWYRSEDNINRMMRAFELGKIDIEPLDAIDKVDRPDVVKSIQTILQPNPKNKTRNYFVIVGETGVGKSTAIREAVSGLPSPLDEEEPAPRGALYFMAPEDPGEFASALATVVDYDPNTIEVMGRLKRLLSNRTQEVPLVRWDVLKGELAKLAIAYKAKHGRQPVLVIDAADFIAKRDSEMMKRLQDFAKTQADMEGLRVVFASSEGSTLPLMTASSSIERGEIIEVGDITDGEALAYLVRHEVPKERAEDAVANILGGRLIRLNNYRSRYANFATNAQYREQFDDDTELALKDLGLKKDHPFFRALLMSGRLRRKDARDFLSAAQLAELLKRNVIAHHADKTFTFHSRVVETFFREQSPSYFQLLLHPVRWFTGY